MIESYSGYIEKKQLQKMHMGVKTVVGATAVINRCDP